MDRIIYIPTAYFGSISYFQHIAKTEKCIIDAFETYPKQTFRNRCCILTANGLVNLSIPVIRTQGSKSKSNEILLDVKQNWRKIHWRSIESAYASSPYFEHYETDIKNLIFNPEDQLIAFNLKITQKIIDILDLKTNLGISETFSADKLNSESFGLLYAYEPYQQVFNNSRDQHVVNLAILDALFNLGPMARKILV